MAKVRVGCKLPNGLVMELVKPHAQQHSISPGPRGQFLHLNGANSLRVARTNPGTYAYGVTLVEEDFARAWFAANKDSAFVRDGFVFFVTDEKEFNGKAKEQAGLRTGLEPINPDGDVRTPTNVTADPDQMKRLGVGAAVRA